MKAYDAGKASPSAVVEIVHQTLDVELDAPRLDSTTFKACRAFVQVMLDDPGESFPALDMLRAQCQLNLTSGPLTPLPRPQWLPVEDPRLAVWDRAYLAALEQMIRVVSPSDDGQLQRCSAVAEVMGVIAVSARAKVSAPGALDDLQHAAAELMKAHAAENDRQARAG